MDALWALLAFAMSLAGGAFAFRYQKSLHLIMAFSSGLLIGIVFLDLIPEIFELIHETQVNPRALMSTLLAGFVAIFLLEKLTFIHSEKSHGAPGHRHSVGFAGAVGLSFHSFLDGLAIGIGFQAGREIGFLVLSAVVAHAFADGLNTVTFMLATKNSRWRTGGLLFVNALAPVSGALLANVLKIDPAWLPFQLAFFAGLLLYLGASDLLPAVHEESSVPLILSTLGGLAAAALLVVGFSHMH